MRREKEKLQMNPSGMGMKISLTESAVAYKSEAFAAEPPEQSESASTRTTIRRAFPLLNTPPPPTFVGS